MATWADFTEAWQDFLRDWQPFIEMHSQGVTDGVKMCRQCGMEIWLARCPLCHQDPKRKRRP